MQGLTVQDVVVESGASASAVRFYEGRGVITAERTAGNQRRFGPSAACRIKVARLAQRVGLSVREVADLFADLPDDPTPADWGRVADRLEAEAEARVAQLRRELVGLRSGDRLCDL